MTAAESRSNALKWAQYAEAQHALLVGYEDLVERLDRHRALVNTALETVQDSVRLALAMINRGHPAHALRVLNACTIHLVEPFDHVDIVGVSDLPADLFGDGN